ncbi:MAG: hypothetical protein WBX29_08975 [Nitrososphaeraceae archaeon]
MPSPKRGASVREESGLIVTDKPGTSIALWGSIGVSGGYTVDLINGGKTVKESKDLSHRYFKDKYGFQL